jgi:transposase
MIKKFPSFLLESVNFLQHLLPDQAQLQLKQWSVDDTEQKLNLTVSTVQPIARCPVCEQSTHRIHSRYKRTLQDLPCANYRVRLLLQVRKFFCVNEACQRRIFTERLPKVTDPWARRTVRLAQHLVTIGFALGGAAGVRLSQRLGHPVSLNPLLQLISRLPFPAITIPTTLGVDDFAFRKGQRYGTILVDLDRHQPIALLKDREANTVATWLQQHPGVQILSRDRSKAYKQGMTQGAPDAIQVADRFHLLQNLTQVLERFLATQSSALKAVDLAQHQALGKARVAPPKPPTAQQQKAEQRRQRRLANYEQVHRLRQQGFAVKDIAHHLGMGERTVFTYLASPQFPEWKQSHRRHSGARSILTPYTGYLLEQWNAGQRQAKRLFEEIVQQGYTGTYKTVAKYTHQLREAQRQELSPLEGRGPAPASIEVGQPPLTSNRAAWLILKPAKQRTDQDETLIAQLQQHPELAPAIGLAQQFADLVRQRQPQQLDSWLEQANHSSVKQFQNFAKSLQEDYEAVKAGVTLSVSNGQVEGQINRLKMLKRQMYGRAGLELLSCRFLLAS